MIKIRDLAYVRFGAPDLDAMEQFGQHFGLAVAAREGDALYLRGSDPSPYCHVTELGDPGFRGLALTAGSEADLAAAAKIPGAMDVEDLKAPGGGKRVRLEDPTGFVVDVVHGRESVPALPVPTALGVNRGSERLRLGEVHRPPSGPSSVKRVGHVVLKVADFKESQAWYQAHFGFLVTDQVYLGDPANVLSAFMRLDLGEEFTDHHTIVLAQLGEPGVDHVAFEVEDIDTLMTGHEHLANADYAHHAGIGRHVLGSQIFDYWKDPWGNVVEHFTDGDVFDASRPPGSNSPDVVFGTLWGKGPVPG